MQNAEDPISPIDNNEPGMSRARRMALMAIAFGVVAFPVYKFGQKGIQVIHDQSEKNRAYLLARENPLDILVALRDKSDIEVSAKAKERGQKYVRWATDGDQDIDVTALYTVMFKLRDVAGDLLAINEKDPSESDWQAKINPKVFKDVASEKQQDILSMAPYVARDMMRHAFTEFRHQLRNKQGYKVSVSDSDHDNRVRFICEHNGELVAEVSGYREHDDLVLDTMPELDDKQGLNPISAIMFALGDYRVQDQGLKDIFLSVPTDQMVEDSPEYDMYSFWGEKIDRPESLSDRSEFALYNWHELVHKPHTDYPFLLE